ncbi:MAG: response regulator transcription factor [Bacteroidales bacterium]
MKIVIADDSSLLRDRIKGLLSSMKNVFVVGEAENGVDALKLIREKKPDLAIIDIRMPEMNGIQVLKEIRELKMKVKVCILTNYAYPMYKKRCFEAGADYFLRKTEEFEEIEIIVRDMLLDKEQQNNKSL